jgi:hypothetical protein
VRRALLAVVVVAGLFATPPAASAQLQPDGIDPDDVLLAVSVEESGDATWTITYRVRLDTNETEAAFSSYRSDVESDPATHRERFHNRMNATAEDASAATGREMAIRNVSVSVDREELPQAYGVVAYRFRWTNFAATEGDALVVGDAIDGLLLDNETALFVGWPSGYERESVTPPPTETRENAVLWEGPRSFASGEPRARVVPAGADGGPDGGGLPGGVPLLAAAAVLLLAGVGAVAAVRRGVGPFGGEPSADPAPTDEALLSNEEQVLRLIEENGGRMKQAGVAEALGWTDAKTSQVTTTLREEGELDAFRLGRENVLELPEEND